MTEWRPSAPINMSPYTDHPSAKQALTPVSSWVKLTHVVANWSLSSPGASSRSSSSYDRDPIGRVREGRLWLIGDAAHPMCPFQGQGANMGMVDSLKLAQYFADLVTSPGQTETAAKAEAL